MYFKSSLHKHPDIGESRHYYCLVERYRNADNRVCHQTILNIGFIEDATPEQLNKIQRILTQRYEHKQPLFEKAETDPVVIRRVEEWWQLIVASQKMDINGTKKLDKVHQRIGCAMEKYPSVQRQYIIEVSVDEATGLATGVSWKKNEKKQEVKENNLGVYFLRTNMNIKEEVIIWNIYNTIREINYHYKYVTNSIEFISNTIVFMIKTIYFRINTIFFTPKTSHVAANTSFFMMNTIFFRIKTTYFRVKTNGYIIKTVKNMTIK